MHSLVVYDILPDPVSELVAAGASRGNDCADAAAFGDHHHHQK